MAKIQDIDIPHLEFAEAAAPGTPAAGIVRIYAKADGLLYSKDDAGTETVVTGGGGGGIDEGTSFPGGPSTGDLFHRTDLTPPLWRYDGTRWLCTCIHEHQLGNSVNISSTADHYTAVMPQGYDMWLIDFISAMEAASGLSGSAYWRADLYSKNAGTLSGVLATTNIQSGANANMIRGVDNIGALLGTTADGFLMEFAKVSTPGNLWGGGIVTYQLVGP